ncbi:MAG: RagB/SusD family nutrient uptake outer membrane protein [Saprospiraceae bacterium]|nr:RagB/SusD family nutrient uptake outer membrane protein [Saprospiraceae bacterium]MBP6694205.1 RagB/SusD family nutrient uptake outer membrane protein [Saprospiraceae bacterium]
MRNIFILLTIVSFYSCLSLDDTVYDRIPESKFPENESQAVLKVVPTYRELADLIDDAGWWFWVQEITSDEIVFPVRLTDWEDGGKWYLLHQHKWTNNIDGVNSMWSHLYDGVTEANRALDDLGDGDPVTTAKLKTLRAFYYYLLLDNYGDVPLVLNFLKAEKQPFKAKRKEIYDHIVNDIKESLPLLPTIAQKFAVSKGMAHTLLAKLYLNSEVYTGTPQWSLAEAHCDSVINSNIYSLEANALSPFSTTNQTSPENIFTIPFDEKNLPGFRLHMRTLHYLHNRTYDMPVGTWNGFCAVEDHYNSFTDDDDRKKGFIVGPQFSSAGAPLFDETAGKPLVINPRVPKLIMDGSFTFEEIRMSGARVGKYEIKKGSLENLSNHFPLFRYADVLLMKTEAMIRQGKNGDSYVNQIRQRAKVSTWSNTTLEMLLAERGREMFCEGHRRQDLIRFGKFNDAWWEKDASSPERNIFPIPQWAIDANPNLL